MAADRWEELDLGDLSVNARQQVAFLLRSESIEIDTERDVIRFPSNLRYIVTSAVEESTTPDPIQRGMQHRRDSHTTSTEPVVAPAALRLVAGFVDYVFIAIATFLLSRAVMSLDWPAVGWIAFAAAELLIVVIPMALTGRPPGALIAGTQVIRTEHDSGPGWTRSAVRWFVAHIPVLIVGVAAQIGTSSPVAVVLSILQLAGLIAIYGGIAQLPLRQGLHDRAADTRVVLRRSLN